VHATCSPLYLLAGLTAGHEGLLYDLLTEGGPPTSLKEVAASLALQRLKATELFWPDDIHQVGIVHQRAESTALRHVCGCVIAAH
jgi:hypothetical protein